MGAPCRVNVESPILDIPFLAIVIVFLPGLPLSAPRAMSTSPRTTRRLSTEATGIDDDSVHLDTSVGRSGLPGSGPGVVGHSATIGVDPYSVVGAIGTLPGGLPRLEQGVRRCTAVRDLMTDGTPCIMESEDGASAGSASGFLDFNIGNGLEGQWNSPYGTSGEPVTLVGKSDSQAHLGPRSAACVAD